VATPTGAVRRRLAGPVALGVSVLLGVSLLPQAAYADPAADIAAVSARVDALEHEAEQAAERWNDARIAATDAQRELDKVNALIKEREAQVAEVQKTVGAIAAVTYRAGGLDSSLQLLMADQPDEFLNQASSLDIVARGQGEALIKAAAAQQQLANDRITAEQQKAVLDAAKATAAAEKQTTDGKLAEAEQLLNSLQAEERAKLAAQQQRAAEAAAREAAATADRLAAQRASTTARATRTSASRTSTASESEAPTSSVPASGRAAAAVDAALSRVGKSYVYGATGPNAFDCSGLTMWAWAKAGVSLPHSSRAQYGSGKRISKSQLRPGDLVFYYSPISHVGMYIGGGKIVHAGNPRTGVNIAGLNSMPYTGAVRP
jgi:peptidoglycan DL-endopeptidase CwlO